MITRKASRIERLEGECPFCEDWTICEKGPNTLQGYEVVGHCEHFSHNEGDVFYFEETKKHKTYSQQSFISNCPICSKCNIILIKDGTRHFEQKCTHEKGINFEGACIIFEGGVE